jgi:glutathione S-transferase
MKLFGSVNSPYARKCRVVLREKALRCEEIMVNSLENPPELLAVNPLGKVPALLTDDGVALCDSSIITEYLDSVSTASRLIPEGAARFEVLALAALADGVMDLAVEWVIQTRRATAEQWPDWIARRKEAILRTLAVIAVNPLLTHRTVTLAHINVACALAYLDFRHPTLAWRADFPTLVNFLESFAERPSMRATQPG